MLVLGLTGSIAMGKSHAARLFRAMGVPVCDADALVHDLFRPGGAAVAPVLAAFPEAADGAGGVDRARLARRVLGDRPALRRLEAIVHPLVRRAQRRFLEAQCRAGRRLVVLDVPLLFETGAERRFDRIVVVSAHPLLQEQRALRRPGMTRERLALLRAEQLPDAVKRRRADFVIASGFDRGRTAAAVARIIRAVRGEPGRAWPRAWLVGEHLRARSR
ncbi:MAG: dephospho-CoA kinase [Geminicoccaceae bacterium]|nr:dephospho-CoA kinase [Geminicoccaceae bacterium]MCS7266546.1 dephospho-CoA kinase [Geminicoccaceae bacterium]MCX7628973.1 dephospho-CoA kinase [Geminicoccaceae bacterium]MDW8125631.1 dephospho-CoA kinase [Geminicoccaceae bacterium]MDW8340079.1 dephospho-CoA kinase [Geminicoccaceae bacterium]